MLVRPLVLIFTLVTLALAACAPNIADRGGQEAPQPAATPASARAEYDAGTSNARDQATAQSGSAAPAARPAAKPASSAPQSAPAESLAGKQPDIVPPRPPDPAPTPAPGNPGQTDLPIMQNLGRMIIYTTDLTILAEDVNGVPQALANIALAAGGYVAGVEAREEGGVPTSVVTLKVPPARYEEVMRGLRGLAVEVRGEKATTQDVTEEYNDVQTQLASLEAAHAQLLELQQRATSVEEVLKIQQEAQRLKLQIDRLKGRSTALERLTEFATITVRAQDAAVVLRRDYVAVRSQLRAAETNRANLELQLQRAKTPEEQAALRDRLAEVVLEISRLEARVNELATLAQNHSIALPTVDGTVAGEVKPAESLPQQYIDTRVALRRAEYEQERLTRLIQAGDPNVDRGALTQAILDVNRLRAELRSIQERANALSITLPTLTPEQEAVLAGIPSSPGQPEFLTRIRMAWEASLTFLSRAATALVTVLVFFWWSVPLIVLAFVIIRRRWTALRATRQAPAAPEA